MAILGHSDHALGLLGWHLTPVSQQRKEADQQPNISTYQSMAMAHNLMQPVF